MTQTNDTPMRDASRDGCGGCWCAARPSPHLAHGIAHAPINSALSACVIRPSLPDLQRLRQELQRSSRRGGAHYLRVPQLR